MATQLENIPRVDFMVPGFSKCGTTSLCDLLSEHPDIYIPKTKEANLFIHDDYMEKWQGYRNFFRHAGKQKMIGEGGTFYTGAFSEKTARTNILRHYPNIKMIFIARDPITRIESSFREFHHSGAKFGLETSYSIGEALRQHPNIVEDTKYWERFNNYLPYIARENIHVMLLENLEKFPGKELKKCFSFLGVDPDFVVTRGTRKLNASSTKYYDTKLLRKLRKNFLLGPTISNWKFEKQHNIFRKAGLRRPAVNLVKWESETLSWLTKEIDDDSHRFLEFAAESDEVWPKFSQFLKLYS